VGQPCRFNEINIFCNHLKTLSIYALNGIAAFTQKFTFA